MDLDWRGLNRPRMKLGDATTQADWLDQHIPHRLRAALAQSNFLSALLAAQIKDEKKRAEKEAYCLEMAAWEGRHAAVRWLIEFVGVTGDDSGAPTESGRRKGRVKQTKGKGLASKFAHDVDIEDLPGGKYFDLADPRAAVLGAVWKGCSQATAHATAGSGHPSIARDRLSEATQIVIQHLGATAYAKAGKTVGI